MMVQQSIVVAGHKKSPLKFVVILCTLLLAIQSGFAQHSTSDGLYIVEPTPALRLTDEDLTTVLLVNNENRATHGRYLNVKPAVGLLTSTARTFIQEGVTTEYATQVLGTTLDNGRLYAQLLKKSSRVLYDKDTVTVGTLSTSTGQISTALFNPQKSLLQSHNDIVADQDWQLIDDHLLGDPKGNLNTFVRNTDFIAPINNPRGALLVFPTQTHMTDENGLVGETNNVNKDLVIASYMNTRQKSDQLSDIRLNETFSVSKSSSSSTSRGSGSKKIAANKVQPGGNLPTFTVKNVFAPSGFFWDSNNDGEKELDKEQEKSEFRSPKILFNRVSDDERMFSTVTYYGFADFTTIVGDTVIVFSPSTSAHSINPEYITSIKGEATLGKQEISHITNVPIMVTKDLIEPTFILQTVATVNPFESKPENNAENFDVETENQENRFNIEQTIQETTPQDEGEKYDEVEHTTLQYEETTLENPEDEKINIKENQYLGGSEVNELESSMTMIEESSSIDVTPLHSEMSTIKMLSTPSNEDILKIYAALASAEAANKMAAEQSHKKNDEKIDVKIEEDKVGLEPEVKIFGGATTIFFEDDPFQAFEMVTKTDQSQVEATQLPTTEKTNVSEDEVGSTTEDTEPIEITTIEEKSATNPTLEEVTEEFHEDTTEHKIGETDPTTKKDKLSNNESSCSEQTETIWSRQTKTLTYLTTFFIPLEDDGTSTSIESNVVTTVDVISSTQLNCLDKSIAPTPTNRAEDINTEWQNIIEKPSQIEENSGVYTATDIIDEDTTVGLEVKEAEAVTTTTTTPVIIVTEKSHVSLANDPSIEGPEEEEQVEEEDEEDDEEQDVEDDAQQSGEEIELIYKTLYTTYTYLTTFFHDSTTSISSRKEVITNVVTSTLSPSMLRADLDVTDILSSMAIQPTSVIEDNEISPTTSVGIGRPTTKFIVPQSDLVQIDDILREDVNMAATEILSDKNIAQSGIRTLYTTYTYYTTIFVDGETEVMSRIEVHTNHISGTALEISPTAQDKIIVDSISDEDNVVLDIKPTTSYETIQRSSAIQVAESASHIPEPENPVGVDKAQMSYVTVFRSADSDTSKNLSDKNTQSIDKSEVVTMVTDVRSSSSDGDRHIIENINKHWNGLLEDQISSESNTEDILPSPTLLLQTSYTTFTFYTTMYSGTATNVVSRLETLTNVVTETLQPTQTINVQDSSLPTTYFTTYTYWTTLAKDGEITTISREETISNVVTPSVAVSDESSSTEQVTHTKVFEDNESSTYVQESALESNVNKIEEILTTQIVASTVVEPTTFYTTYTYYTTSYAGDDTIINSRFETMTNIVTPTTTISGRSFDINAVDLNKIDARVEKIPVKFDPVFISPSNVDQNSLEINPTVVMKEQEFAQTTTSNSIVSLNKGKIVDAEGISTIFYTTEAIASNIDGKYTEVTYSTSSINIDEDKKSMSQTEVDPAVKTYKTGLVRLIEGTMIANRTTTLYQSKVIGTIIEGRYAQIIESTSSFLIEKSLEPSSTSGQISATNVQLLSDIRGSLQTVFTQTPSFDSIESSINEGKDDQESQTEISTEDDEDEGGFDENGRPRSRLSFSTRKRTFTPVIRPFASRNRPQFAPKRKNLSPSSATIITRLDLTPTITATPAIKNDNSRGRFSSTRKGSSTILNPSANVSGSSRRFSRPRSSSSAGFSSSAYPGSSRNRASSSRAQIQPTSSYFGLSSRRGGGSSAGRFSSAYLDHEASRDHSHHNNHDRYATRPLTAEATFMRNRNAKNGNTPILSLPSYTIVGSEIAEDDLATNKGRQFFGGLEEFNLSELLEGGGGGGSGDDGGGSGNNNDKNENVNEFATSASFGEEARYNLATRVMSNGVEVIVASDKSKLTHKQSVFRILPSNLYKPLTLAPSTLKDQMVLVMPSESKNNLTISMSPNQFVTKTCLTTYTYRTTYLQDGKTTVESREKVISNIATEERNYLKISPTASFGVTLSHTPELAIGVFHTTYTYLNTILNGELPIVISSKQTVTNTITGPDDYILFLQPSEEAAPVYETNTYYSKIDMTKTLKDRDIHKIVSASNILTQVIVTESLPPKISSITPPYIPIDIDEISNTEMEYITYKYYNTSSIYDDSSNLISPGNVTEKLFLYTNNPSAAALKSQDGIDKINLFISSSSPILTDHAYSTAMATNSINIYSPSGSGFEAENTIHVYATKTYLTTFTYYTTLLKNNEDRVSSTVVDSHTRVIENVITESIPNYMLDSELLEEFSKDLINPTHKQSIITMATLLGGHTLKVTAVNMLQPFAPGIKIASNIISSSINKAHGNHHIKSSIIANSTENNIVTNVENNVDNIISDSITSESENDEVYVDEYNDAATNGKFPNNNTKIINKTEFPMANLIGSFNLNSLTALGPVFNAMAGLIQNNLNSNKRNNNITLIRPVSTDSNGSNSYKNITTYGNVEFDQDHRSPIYIPVRGIHSSNEPNNNYYIATQASPTSLHISPPEKWIADEKMNRNNKLDFPLNKPTYETPLLNGGIPISPGEVITANSDVIIGKPAGTRPRVPFSTKLKNNEQTPNIIPLNRFQGTRNRVDNHFDMFIRPPPPPPPQSQAAGNSPHIYQKQAQSLAKKNLPHRHNHNHPYHHTNVQNHHQNIPLVPLQQSSGGLGILNRDMLNNEILEIKRIPEVYSTDLPPVEIGFQRHQTKHAISTNEPMLVNIKPSQVANVVIPHGGNTNSVLIIDSTPELHKTGQYFDEPSAYPNTIITDKIPNEINAQQPIISNQQINLDSHVLSHNVNIHVPPLTFKKENDFPYSTPVHGHIQKNGQFHITHVNIPATDHEIEVNLTPQLTSLQNSYLQLHNKPMQSSTPINGYDTQKDIETSVSFLSAPQIPIKNLPSMGNQFDSKLSSNNRFPPHYKNDDISSHLLPPANLKGYHYENQRHPVGFEFDNYRKQQGVNNNFPQNSFHPLKRRPIPHITPLGNPFGVKNYKTNPSVVYKPRPIIPISAGNYGPIPNFDVIPRPGISTGTSYKEQSTANTIEMSLPSKIIGDFTINRNELDVVGTLNDSNFYHVQQYNNHNNNSESEHFQNTLLIENGTYNHRDDDYDENEEGEVVQETNSLPVIPGQYLNRRPETPLVSISNVTSTTTEEHNAVMHTTETTSRPMNTKTTATGVIIPSLYVPAAPLEINNLRNTNGSFLSASMFPPIRNWDFTSVPNHRRPPLLPLRPLEQAIISQGEKFKKPVRNFTNNYTNSKSDTVQSTIDSLNSYVRVSLPINPSADNYKDSPSLTQTEAPFSPEYNNHNPLRNLTAYGSKLNFQKNKLNDAIVSTTSKSAEISHKNKVFIEKHSGEEIFDFKETVNPHNLGVINNLEDSEKNIMTTLNTNNSSIESIKNHQNQDGEKNVVFNYNSRKKINNNNNHEKHAETHATIPEPSVNIRPPSVLLPIWKTEEVMGLSPPPPPTSMAPPPPILSISHNNLYLTSTTHPLYSPVRNIASSQPAKSTNYNTISILSGENLSTYKPDSHSPSLPNQVPSNNVENKKQMDRIKYTLNRNQYPQPTEIITKKSELHLNSFLNNTNSTQNTIIKKNKYNNTGSVDNTISEKATNPFNITLKTEFALVPDSNKVMLSTKQPTRLRTTKRKPNTPQHVHVAIHKNVTVNHQSEIKNLLESTKSAVAITKTTTTTATTNQINIAPTRSIKIFKSTTLQIDLTPSSTDTSIFNENNPTISNTQMFNPKQKIPDEILVLDSDNPVYEDYHIHKMRISLDGRKQTTPLSNIIKKTRLAASKVILPTQYITNTKTVTTTITTVVESEGVPLTQTLTKIKTSTIVDTVTETQTHTLVQPTKVTISSPPEIRTTITTIYTLPEHQNYPEFHNTFFDKDGDDKTVLFVEDSETNLDDLIINYDDDNDKNAVDEQSSSTTTTTTVGVVEDYKENKNPGKTAIPTENDSIFVVMTDKKNPPGVISINMSMMEHHVPTIETIGTSDYETIPFDLPDRDEDIENKETNHVLLGGILIASPPKTNSNFHRNSAGTPQCKPDCKASRNELCQRIEGIMRCVCRPGFARMFPDRPCKPTYTYSLSLPLHRFGKEVLRYDERLSDTSSEEFFYLAEITHEALHRMVMQSDFRDVYHGVHVTEFKKTPKDNAVIGNFYLQLSDNSDENRLVDVFKKYLRSNNYSIGGTELYIAKAGVDKLRAKDFDECLDPKFHDCSDNSQCFNLHGTYTCSCREGYADLSENPVYPGRKCSADLIGCERCYYHGTCYTPNDMDQPICECFHWYAGASCHVNLKILLIALIAIGVGLLILLFFCVLVTSSKRRKAKSVQSLIAGINILPPKNTKSLKSSLKIDKRAMIKDSSSEASHNSDTLPYHSRKEGKKHSIPSVQSTNHIGGNNQRNVPVINPQPSVELHCNLLDQNDRSLTVMIPRAKYHPVLHQSSSHLNLDVRSTGGGGGVISNTAESKILSYLDAGMTPTPMKKMSSASSKQAVMHSLSTGALVSAGFEVSATVGQDLEDKTHLGHKTLKTDSQSQLQYSGYRKGEKTVSEARSYDETTIQPTTKSIRSVYDKQFSQNNNEVGTMVMQ